MEVNEELVFGLKAVLFGGVSRGSFAIARCLHNMSGWAWRMIPNDLGPILLDHRQDYPPLNCLPSISTINDFNFKGQVFLKIWTVNGEIESSSESGKGRLLDHRWTRGRTRL